MSFTTSNLPVVLNWSFLPDEELLDLIECAFLEAQIDGETLSLAFAWVERNDVQVH